MVIEYSDLDSAVVSKIQGITSGTSSSYVDQK
jgi:hypothetical protein